MSVSRSLPAGDVLRARMILMLADGRSYVEIQERMQTTAPTISRWKKRFLNERINGLIQMRHPGQKPKVVTPKFQARVLEATRRKPKDGSTHWSVRKLARELNVSKDAVHRVWRAAGVKPHRLERYMVSDDLDFESKAADIIGLYCIRRNTQRYSVSTKNRRFRPWTDWIRFCRFRRAVSNGMDLSTIATAPYPCMQRST